MNLAFTTILVATDFSDASALALEYARMLAARFDAGLRVVHVVETPRVRASEMLTPDVPAMSGGHDVAIAKEQLAKTLARIGGEQVIGQVLVGQAARAIVEYAADHAVDLIVMGTHGRSGLAHLLLGSVAERVVRTAPCPVFTARESDALRCALAEYQAAAAG